MPGPDHATVRNCPRLPVWRTRPFANTVTRTRYPFAITP